MFSTRLDNFLPFSSNLKLSSANSFSLVESKIVVWDRVKFKRSSDETIKMAKNELKVEKGRKYCEKKREIASYQHFLLSRQCFQKAFFLMVVRFRDCFVKASPFPKRQILNSTKLNEFADDNFKVDENGRKISKRVENTVGKG